jgi:hypothetical protein
VLRESIGAAAADAGIGGLATRPAVCFRVEPFGVRVGEPFWGIGFHLNAAEVLAISRPLPHVET